MRERPVAHRARTRVHSHIHHAVLSKKKSLWHYQPLFGKTFRNFADRIDRVRAPGDRLVMTARFVGDLRINFR